MIDTEKLDKLQRYSRAIAALGLAIFFALIVISFWSLWRVRKEIAGLEDKKQELTRDVQKMEEKRRELEEQNAALLPAAVKQELQEQKPELSQTISEIAKQRPESVKKAINQAIAEQLSKAPSNQENKNTKQAIERLVQAAPSVARNLTRVYLHITDEKQRPRARRIAEQLKQTGYIVPAIEDVSDRKLRISTQVRYYDAFTEAEKAEAQKIRSLLQEWGIKAEALPIKAPSRPWQYEIWFGSDFN